MFTAALFTIGKIRCNLCPATDEWIDIFLYKRDYYSAIIKNEILPFATTWMDLMDTMLRERSQTEKDK